MKPRPRVPRVREVVAASDAVAAALKLRGLTDEIRANRLLTEWTDMVGPKISARTRPDGIVDRLLWIEVATSAWLQELNLLRPQLLRGLLERVGEPTLFDDLRFRLAGRTHRNAVVLRGGRRVQPRPPRPLGPPASGAARERIVREVAAVDDAELRELIARIRIVHDR